jgi:Protein of unknown function (DUF1236)
MNKPFLSTTAAAALALGVVAASAQQADPGTQRRPMQEQGATQQGGATSGAERLPQGQQGQSAEQPRMQQDRAQTQQQGTQQQPQGAQTQQREGDVQRRETTRETTREGGDATGAITLSSEARTKFREVVRSRNVTRVNVDIDVRVGAVVPATVTTFYDLPPDLCDVYRIPCSYKYIVLTSGEIIIINPSTRAIVLVIEA